MQLFQFLLNKKSVKFIPYVAIFIYGLEIISFFCNSHSTHVSPNFFELYDS